MKATVRCWPDGKVISSVEMEFVVAPVVGDVIEIAEFVALLVTRRRFDPDGGLWLWCEPEPGSSYEFEMLRDAFDEARDRDA